MNKVSSASATRPGTLRSRPEPLQQSRRRFEVRTRVGDAELKVEVCSGPRKQGAGEVPGA